MCLHDCRCSWYQHVALPSLTPVICHVFIHCLGSFLLQDMFLSLYVFAFEGQHVKLSMNMSLTCIPSCDTGQFDENCLQVQYVAFYHAQNLWRFLYPSGTAEPGGAGGASTPNNFEKNFFSIEKLLFYCFHRYAIINEDFRQWALWYAVNWFLHLGHAIWRPLPRTWFLCFLLSSIIEVVVYFHEFHQKPTTLEGSRRYCNQYGTLNVGTMACFRYFREI